MTLTLLVIAVISICVTVIIVNYINRNKPYLIGCQKHDCSNYVQLATTSRSSYDTELKIKKDCTTCRKGSKNCFLFLLCGKKYRRWQPIEK